LPINAQAQPLSPLSLSANPADSEPVRQAHQSAAAGMRCGWESGQLNTLQSIRTTYRHTKNTSDTALQLSVSATTRRDETAVTLPLMDYLTMGNTSFLDEPPVSASAAAAAARDRQKKSSMACEMCRKRKAFIPSHEPCS